MGTRDDEVSTGDDTMGTGDDDVNEDMMGRY